jgi:hypothetical protein
MHNSMTEQLASALRSTADELAEEVRSRYGDRRFRYLLERDRFNRDMKTVDAAYELLDRYEESKTTSPQFDALLCELGALGVRLDVLKAQEGR